MKVDEIGILQADTFMVGDRRGDVDPATDQVHGLFYRDMRHLSRWQLRLNGSPLQVLSSDILEYDEAVFFLVEANANVHHTPSVSIIRRRQVAAGLRESVTIHNHGTRVLHLEVSILYGADFADIFELKDPAKKAGTSYQGLREGGITLGYHRGGYCRETHVSAEGAYFTEESLTFRLELGPMQQWTGEVDVTLGVAEGRPLPRRTHTPDMPVSLQDWLGAAPRIETDWTDLRLIYHRSLVDLAALRFYPDGMSDASLPAAGLPWFMALFGRDSIITSYQTLPFVPELARTTLWALAAKQATDYDDFRDAEPGKILHELRHGELAYFGECPQSPYYGAADTTALFLILLDEYERWTGDTATVLRLEAAARAALHWLEKDGDLDGDGYLEYRTRNPATGLVNQCWKDSWNSIVHPDGTLASLPRATCEIQGYAYDARVRCARLAREVWADVELAVRLERDAEQLKRRFDADFWLPEGGSTRWPWTGRSARCARSPPTSVTCCGAGSCRTNGSSLVAHLWASDVLRLGGAHDGRRAAGLQPGRVPQRHGLAARHRDRRRRARPVRPAGGGEPARDRLAGGRPPLGPPPAGGVRRVPPGGDPGAGALPDRLLAAGLGRWAPLLLLRVLLGMEPAGDQLRVDPRLPGRIGRLALRGVVGRWGRVDVEVESS